MAREKGIRKILSQSARSTCETWFGWVVLIVAEKGCLNPIYGCLCPIEDGGCGDGAHMTGERGGEPVRVLIWGFVCKREGARQCWDSGRGSAVEKGMQA